MLKIMARGSVSLIPASYCYEHFGPSTWKDRGGSLQKFWRLWTSKGTPFRAKELENFIPGNQEPKRATSFMKTTLLSFHLRESR